MRRTASASSISVNSVVGLRGRWTVGRGKNPLSSSWTSNLDSGTAEFGSASGVARVKLLVDVGSTGCCRDGDGKCAVGDPTEATAARGRGDAAGVKVVGVDVVDVDVDVDKGFALPFPFLCPLDAYCASNSSNS